MAEETRVKNIQINMKWCKKCGICVEFCPKNVYAKGNLGEPKVVSLDDCTGCRLCELYCPDFAIVLIECE